ncbi:MULTISPECIES: ketoacyl-ACP synthase III family protein [Streptosporangium]|uniref:3-oxoacyl-[acyl-carrier-protein] synthase III n=1 Tax=Streptosporangium brasiliense TaxID=47480 RepID=A0ABT9R5D1_9ACTN|nr:ketoacyl-ACP synthase III family protein [Streptosporangium brasiliense]MDP9863645.1 3-oxoacyl-[acyl-carrier-protein] synthase III [Streptosporangium brasiliense]
MRTPNVFISALGAFVPPTVNVEWAVERGLYPAEDVKSHELGGAAVAGEIPPPEMALRAAQQAVKRWGGSPLDFDLLLYASTWHQGPDGWPPHSYLQRHLVGGDLLALEIRQGCNGLFSAMELAASHLLAVPERTGALLVAADNYGTPLIDRWRMGPGFIGGDAACALVLTKRPGFARLRSVCSRTIPEAEALHRGDEPLFPPSITRGRPTDFSARIGQQFATRSPASVAMATMPEHTTALVDQALEESGIEIGDITRVAFMNYSREVVEQRVMAAWGLPMTRSTWEFGRTIGHCGASDHILSFEHLVRTGELGPGDHMLMLGTAPGLVVSCVIVQVLESPAWEK